MIATGRAGVEWDSTGRRRKILTNATVAYTMHLYAIVEVANVISTVLEQAIAEAGKGSSPKDAGFAKSGFLGRCRICTGLSSNSMVRCCGVEL